MNKFIIPFFVFLITIFTSLGLSPFEPLFGSASNLGDIYSRAPGFIDSLLYLVFFISLSLFSLEKVFSKHGEVNKYGKTIAIVVGVALAVAASIWSTTSGFNLSGFGWMAGMLFIGFIFGAVFKVVKTISGNNKKAEAIAYIIIYFCAFWVFPRVGELLINIPWLTLIFSLLFIIALFYLFAGLFSKFKLAGGGSEGGGGGSEQPGKKKPGWTSQAKLWFNKKGVSKISDEIKSIERMFDRKEKRSLKDVTDSINSLKKTGKQIIDVKDALDRLKSSSDIDDNIKKKIEDLNKELDSLDDDRTKLVLKISEELKELVVLEDTKIKVYQEQYKQVKERLDKLINGLEKESNDLSYDIDKINLPVGSNPKFGDKRKKTLELLTEGNSLLKETKTKIEDINSKLLYVVGQERKTRDKLNIAQDLWDKIKVDKEMTKDQLTVINELGEKFVKINFDETKQNEWILQISNYIKGFEKEVKKINTDYFDKVRTSIGELNDALRKHVKETEDSIEKKEESKKEASKEKKAGYKNEFSEKIRNGFETLGLINGSINSLENLEDKEKFTKQSKILENELTKLQISDSIDEGALSKLLELIETFYNNIKK